MKTDLSKFDNSWYNPGAGLSKRSVWYFVNVLFFKSSIPFPSAFKVILLKLFGAEIGRGCVIKPNVNIKYPWKLKIGLHCWIGEGVWIDNLDFVTLENNVCVSQDAYLLCGNHNYKLSTFDLMTGHILLEEGCWIGAKSTVCPGVTIGSHAVLSVGSVATKNLEPFTIYQGNPAVRIKQRVIAK